MQADSSQAHYWLLNYPTGAVTSNTAQDPDIQIIFSARLLIGTRGNMYRFQMYCRSRQRVSCASLTLQCNRYYCHKIILVKKQDYMPA